MHLQTSYRPCLPQRHHTVTVFSSKGFGSAKQKTGRTGGGKGQPETAKQAADQALADAAANRPKVRPINPKEAASGKVDYVKVKDWADGKAADIGELQVVDEGYTAGAYSAAAGNTSGPFYQQLAQHAQYLESQGALSIALEPGARPFLAFESWQYSMPRYSRYLAELAAVHEALEEALQLALSPPSAEKLTLAVATTEQSSKGSTDGSSSPSNSSSSTQAPLPWQVPGRSAAVTSAYAALNCYGSDCGLWRAAAAAADLEQLLDLAAVRDQDQHENNKRSKQQQQQKHHSAAAEHKQHISLHASQNAIAYGKYILQLGRAAAAATAAVQTARTNNSSKASSSLLVAEEDEGYRAVLKLIAHAYAVHVQQQCLGTRIGAAATEHLDLLTAGVRPSLYLDYPEHVKEPLEQLIAVTNAAGKQLDAAGKQVVLDELPKALKKATLLLAPLATA